MSVHAEQKPWTVPALAEAKREGRRLAMLTAYDAGFARVMDRNGIDLVLVGDSLGMVVQGHDSTLPVSTDDMVYHTACVARGLLPFANFNRLHVVPPCNTSEDDMREGLAILDEAFGEIDRFYTG